MTEKAQAAAIGREPVYLTKPELARRLGVSLRTIDTLMRQRKIPFIKLSARLVRFPVKDVDAYLASKLRVNARDE